MGDLGNREIFAKNLMYYISKHEKDQKEIAEVIGVAPSTFNAYVKAKKYPRIEKIEKLANYFGISKSDLIEEHDFFDSVSTSITQDEKNLLQLYRTLSQKQQKMLLGIIDVVFQSSEN